VSESLQSQEETSGSPSGEPLPEPVRSGLTPGSQRLVVLAALLVLPAVTAAGTLKGWSGAAGAAGGGTLAVLNLVALSRLVVAVTGQGEPSLTLTMLGLVGKLALVGGTLAALVFGLRVEPIGVLLGVSVVFGAVLLDSMVGRRG
jgi:hypothetical protein